MESTTMKKTYINPEMEIVRMKMNQHLLDGSPAAQVLDPSDTPISSGDDIGSHGDEFDW